MKAGISWKTLILGSNLKNKFIKYIKFLIWTGIKTWTYSYLDSCANRYAIQIQVLELLETSVSVKTHYWPIWSFT